LIEKIDEDVSDITTKTGEFSSLNTQFTHFSVQNTDPLPSLAELKTISHGYLSNNMQRIG
jgi:hypothetical protein